MAYDNICRYLAAEYPSPFVLWLLAIEPSEIQPLPTELRLDPIRSDALFFLPERQQILHLEFQTLPTSVPSLPLRMLDYWVRLYRQYGYSIEQVVIFLQETNSDAVYIEQFAAGNTTHRYRVVRLWEQDPRLLLASPALLPLAVLAQTDNPATLLEQVAAQIDMIEETELRRNISACTEVLASLKFEKDFIQQYLREELMRESVIYQEILQQGRQQGKLEAVILLLTSRIGTVPSELQAQIQALSMEKLDRLCQVLLNFSNNKDLTAWLQAQSETLS